MQEVNLEQLMADISVPKLTTTELFGDLRGYVKDFDQDTGMYGLRFDNGRGVLVYYNSPNIAEELIYYYVNWDGGHTFKAVTKDGRNGFIPKDLADMRRDMLEWGSMPAVGEDV